MRELFKKIKMLCTAIWWTLLDMLNLNSAPAEDGIPLIFIEYKNSYALVFTDPDNLTYYHQPTNIPDEYIHQEVHRLLQDNRYQKTDLPPKK